MAFCDMLPSPGCSLSLVAALDAATPQGYGIFRDKSVALVKNWCSKNRFAA
jgi:hypothetical protein